VAYLKAWNLDQTAELAVLCLSAPYSNKRGEAGCFVGIIRKRGALDSLFVITWK
jgi:hypothetical protein